MTATTTDPGRSRISTTLTNTDTFTNTTLSTTSINNQNHMYPHNHHQHNHDHSHPPTATTAFTLHNLVASSAAALCSRLCTHPLDTLKTRIQVSNTRQPLLSTLGSLVKTGGLYRGLPIALTLSVPGLSVYLTAYDLTKEHLARKFSFLGTDTVLNHLSSAVVAEVSSGLFWTPMEILKSKQQVENMSASTHFATKISSATTGSTSIPAASSITTKTRTGTFALAKKIYRQEGLAGFYRGYFITLGVFVPYSMIYFATYEQLKEMAWQRIAKARRSQDIVKNHSNTDNKTKGGLYAAAVENGHRHRYGHDALQEVDVLDEDETLPFMTIVGCAAVACGIAAGVSNVVDVVKTRWQTSSVVVTSKVKNQSVGGVDSLSSARKIARHMFQQGGLRSFTQGMGARVLWMIPSVTISMSVFEWIKAHGFVI